ncbi:MAG: hypothetical protein R8K20_11725 [Gallionellaceae bacterium]
MSDVALVIQIGRAERVEQVGEYIAVKESNVPVDIHIQGVGTMKMQKGEVWRIKGGFDGFSIENYGAVAGNILLAVGYGDYRAALSVGNLDTINTIVNPITINTPSVQKIIETVNVSKAARSFPGSYNFYSVPAFAPVEIIAPLANVNGVVIGNIGICANVNVTAAFLGKATLPVGGVGAAYADNQCRVYGRVLGGFTCLGAVSGEFIIPAGLGLYAVSDGMVTMNLEYEVL